MRMLTALLIAGSLPAISLAAGAPVARPNEAIVGLPCEGCEAVFVGMPQKLARSARIAPKDEPGAPLTVSGLVTDEAGVAQPGVVIYAYQTDHGGIYPRAPELNGAAARHGRLRGWAQTDGDGRYEFRTIRPGAYPGSSIPQHIHMHVIEPGRCTYYIGDIFFADDPLLTAALAAREASARGSNGVAQPIAMGDGAWRVNRDVTLGANVPGYADCSQLFGYTDIVAVEHASHGSR